MKKISPVLFFLFFSLMAYSQQITVSSGAVKRFENFPSQFVPARNIDVWLPREYTPSKKYAVLYMHDGQMLYDSTTTWNHQEWGVDEVAGKLIRQKKTRDFIVVGIWNGGPLRHSEYFPQKPLNFLTSAQKDSLFKANRGEDQPLFTGKIRSDNYLSFIVKELKPFIDRTFSTHKNAKNTFVAGSSMGGLISMYAICEYPEVFGGAACLSTHWIGTFSPENNPIPGAFMEYLKGNLPDPKHHKIYFDYGTATLDSFYKPFQLLADEVMKSKGYESKKNWISREFEGEDHSERAWRKRLDIPLVFLLE